MDVKNFLLICLIIELVQIVRYFNAVEKLNEKNDEEYNNFYSDSNKNKEDNDVYQLSGDDAQPKIVDGAKNPSEKTDGVYKGCEIFLNRNNIKMELFKSYMISPLECFLYFLFMINIICSLGQYISLNFDNPVVGLKAFVQECNANWKGALFIGAILMYRIVSKKLEDLTYLHALKYTFGFGKKKERKR